MSRLLSTRGERLSAPANQRSRLERAALWVALGAAFSPAGQWQCQATGSASFSFRPLGASAQAEMTCRRRKRGGGDGAVALAADQRRAPARRAQRATGRAGR